MTDDRPEDDPNPYRSPQPEGVIPQRAPHSDPGNQQVLAIVVGLIHAAQCVRWCHYDRLERHGSEWRYFAVAMLLCPGPLIAFPLYLWSTRGFVRGTRAVLAALGFLLALLAVHIAMALACTYVIG